VPSPSLGVHVLFWGQPDATRRDLRLAKEAGFTFVKQRFEWRNIERDGKGQLEWNEPDRIVREVTAAGLDLVVRIDNQPRWARRDGLFPGTGPPTNLNDWRDYVSRVAARYRGKIAAYEVWNEPNIDREWGEGTPNAAEYAALLKVSYQAIKAADPDAIVISAGLSPTTNDGPQARPDTVFLEELYQLGAGVSFDMLGVHAAGFKAEPEADPADVAADPELTNGDPSPVELKRIYAFRHVEDIRTIMVKHGDADKRIAITEMGWTSDTRPGSPYRWHAVTEEQKGHNVVRAFRLAEQRWQPWIAYMTLIYLPQADWTQRDEQYWWSIAEPNGTPRRSYELIKAGLGR
jgi:polysaccharide biosynthesis protein PslG